MGFYGNITNTSNTTFQFDKIYPNRRTMEASANNDSIFVGRHVLIEYDQSAAYPVVYVEKIPNENLYYAYSSPNKEEITRIKWLGNSLVDQQEEAQDGIYTDEYVQTIKTVDDGNIIGGQQNNINFYQCWGGRNGFATFVSAQPATDGSDYIRNFGIDEEHYTTSDTKKGFKGYDSTVWTKVGVQTSDGKLVSKYVNIAELNSVVPTFDITADAPTMTPITPHFDADSTNVYYKLHAQPQWGFRVAHTDADKSDEKTQWVRDFYDVKTDTVTKNYASSVTRDGIPVWGGNNEAKLDAAIYYNADGFKKQLLGTDEREGAVKKHSKTVSSNEIKIEATGKSGIAYNDHNGKQVPSRSIQVDTQELTINLPAIGNMMSDAWDIIHGPNRDNARTDKNGSLQGRLDSFKAFYDNQIPVKIQDGTLVGSKINNAIKYDSNWEGKPNDILYDTTTPNFERDDAWIKTEINTSELKTGDKNSNEKQENNSGISIHHTFHATKNSTSSMDKNIENGNIIKSDTYKSDKILSNNLSNIGDKKDFIELYTPYVDATGHVVGKNIETITLPYGYKTFTTNGLVNETDADLDASTGRKTVANNTQDTLAVNTKNKWLQVEITNDKIELAHEIHDTTNSTNTTDWTQTEANTTIPTTTYEFDNAGHYVSHHTENYKLPFGYGKIVGDSGSTEATATFDELTISADDNWIATTVSDDQVNITHTGPVVISVPDQSNIVDPNFGSTFTIEDWYFDAKGHKHTGKTHTVQFPKGSLNDLTATGSSVLTGISMIDETGDITQQNANVGTLTLAEYTQGQSGGLKISDTNTINGAFKGIQDYINTLDMSDTSNTQFITKITQTDGQVAVERAAAGTLQLGTASTDGTIPESSSLNNAFNITNARIKKEEDALAKEIQDRIDAIDALTGVKDYSEHFDTMKEIADWLDANKDGVVDITLNITANTKAISEEVALARNEEDKLTQAIEAEELRAQDAEADLQNQIDSLGTAAWSRQKILQLRLKVLQLKRQFNQAQNLFIQKNLKMQILVKF